jgi:cytochrome c2
MWRRALVTGMLGASLAGCSGGDWRGRQLFVGSGCVRCHGADLNGTAHGPALSGLRYNWTEDQLMRYLDDPNEFVKTDERLKTLSQRFSSPMPSFGALDESSRRALAKYLIERKE